MTKPAPTSPTRTIQGAKKQMTVCECLRCGYLWKPHRPDPVKCPACYSPLWNKERVYKIVGAEAPTQKAKPRGKPFQAGFDQRREGDKDSDKAADKTEPKADASKREKAE